MTVIQPIFWKYTMRAFLRETTAWCVIWFKLKLDFSIYRSLKSYVRISELSYSFFAASIACCQNYLRAFSRFDVFFRLLTSKRFCSSLLIWSRRVLENAFGSIAELSFMTHGRTTACISLEFSGHTWQTSQFYGMESWANYKSGPRHFQC